MHELDGYQSAHFPLKRFEVLNRSSGRGEVIYAPEHWRDRLNLRDRICVVHPDGDYRLQIDFEVFRRHRDTARQCDGLVARLVGGMQALRLVRPIATAMARTSKR